MSENRELKLELINQLSFLLGLKEKVWQYHPNNPNAKSVVDEYTQLQIDIEAVEKALKDVD
tara:strand:- start:224 stop:406 length:183 start_codon:yes stop_codon:yes gene_type:complete